MQSPLTIESGWSDLEEQPAGPTEADDQIARSFVRTFTTNDGAKVLDHLLDHFRNCQFGPEASDALLRHAEGRREVVGYIQKMIKRGQKA